MSNQEGINNGELSAGHRLSAVK